MAHSPRRENPFQRFFSEERARRELSLEAIAEICDISASYAQQIESGKRIPDDPAAVRIARGLGKEPAELIILATRAKAHTSVRPHLSDDALRRALGPGDPPPGVATDPESNAALGRIVADFNRLPGVDLKEQLADDVKGRVDEMLGMIKKGMGST